MKAENNKEISEGNPEEMSLPEWCYFKDDLQLIYKDVLTRVYSTFGAEPLQNFHINKSNIHILISCVWRHTFPSKESGSWEKDTEMNVEEYSTSC